MTADEFRRLALSFKGATEGSHMGAVDFRVGGRIFATLANVAQGYGNLLLSPAEQAEICAERPDVFRPIPGGWGKMGGTHVVLALAGEDEVASAMHVAWKRRLALNAKGPAVKTHQPATGKTPARASRKPAPRTDR